MLRLSEASINQKHNDQSWFERNLTIFYKHKRNFSFVSNSALCWVASVELWVAFQIKFVRLRHLLLIGFPCKKKKKKWCASALEAQMICSQNACANSVFAGGLMSLPSLSSVSQRHLLSSHWSPGRGHLAAALSVWLCGLVLKVITVRQPLLKGKLSGFPE